MGDIVRLLGSTVLVVVLGADLRALPVPCTGWWVFATLVVVPLAVVSGSALALDQRVHPPAVHRWPGPVVNACSLGPGRRASLHVGDAAVDALDGDALDAVLLHELHHLRPAARVRAGAWLAVTSVATAFLVLPVVALLLLCASTTLRRPGRLLLAVLGGRRGVGALGVLRASLPSPDEVDAVRSTGEPIGPAPRLGHRCTVPVLGRRDTDLTPTPTSLDRRREGLAALVDGLGEGGARSRSVVRRG